MKITNLVSSAVLATLVATAGTASAGRISVGGHGGGVVAHGGGGFHGSVGHGVVEGRGFGGGYRGPVIRGGGYGYGRGYWRGGVWVGGPEVVVGGGFPACDVYADAYCPGYVGAGYVAPRVVVRAPIAPIVYRGGYRRW